VRKQLVAVETADHSEDAVHLRVGERRVQVRHPRRHRRGFEVVSLIDVVPEGQPQPQGGKANIDHAAVIVLGHERAAASWRHHPYRVAAVKLAWNGQGRCSHPYSAPPTWY
jgi:hypothetical protein